MKKILFLLCLACCASFLHGQHTQYSFSYDELINRKAVELKANTALITLPENGDTYLYWMFKSFSVKTDIDKIVKTVSDYHDLCFWFYEDMEVAEPNTDLSSAIKTTMQCNKYYASITILSFGGMNVKSLNEGEFFYQECVMYINTTEDFKTYKTTIIHFSCYKR